MKGKLIKAALLGSCLTLSGTAAVLADGPALQPYVMAYTASGDLAAQMTAVKTKLSGAGFQVLGDYSPYAGADVICITNPAMLQAAAGKPMGGFGAVEHVALTQTDGKIQVSYLNPPYMAAAYQMGVDYQGVAAALGKALGAERTFGTKSGESAGDLGDYHYMIGMEYFKDVYKLGHHKSHAEAVQTVLANLKKGVGGAGLIYQLDIPGTEQTMFGVSRANVSDQAANDKAIMADTIDPNFKDKTTAYLPYEMMVDGKDVIALHMRFRMAVWHPDLTMVTFSKIITSPGAIESLLKKVAGGEVKSSDF